MLSIKKLFLSLAVIPLSGCLINVAEPEGQYSVGSVSYELVDTSRFESMTRDPDDVRRLMLELWYPSQPHTFTRMGRYVELLPKLIHSKIDEDIADIEGPLPLVVMSHGLAGNRNHSEFLSEDLASKGYLVAGFDHTYYSGPVLFPDGKQAGTVFDMLKFLEVPQETLDQYFQVWVEDCHFVFEEILKINNDPESMFYQKIDTDRIAMVSHSFGGAMGIQCASENNLIKATLTMDGSPFGSVKQTGTDIPFMMIWANADENKIESNLEEGLYQNSPDFIWASMDNTEHGDFTDLNTLVNPGGTPNIKRKQEIIKSLTHAFLDHHIINGGTLPLDKSLFEFPEVTSGFSDRY